MSVDPYAGEAEKGKSEDAAPPEIEAEIVDADFTVADQPPGEEAHAPRQGEAEAARRPPALPPRLILPAAIAVVAAVATVTWLAWPRSKPAPAPAVAAPSEIAEPEDALAEPELPAVAAGAAPSHPAPPDPSKISNIGAAAAKSGLSALDTAPVEGARGLPEPPPPGSANDSLQRSAKEALRALESGPPDAREEPAIDLPIAPEEAGPQAPVIEDGFERLQEEAEARAAEEAAGRLASADAATTEPAAAAKIGNDVDVAALKELFATETSRLSSELSTERERSEALARDVASLKENLNAAIDSRGETRTEEELAALRAEVEKIRWNREEAAAGKVAAATFALVGLQQKIAAGAPYENQLKMLEGLAPGVAGFEALRTRAATGVPTLGALKTRFGPAVRRTLIADREARAKGVWGRLAARLEGLVSVRPATPQAGNSARAIISRAEARLAADDLGGCVAELRALDGAARAAIAPWLDDAEARVSADAALASLSVALAGWVQN